MVIFEKNDFWPKIALKKHKTGKNYQISAVGSTFFNALYTLPHGFVSGDGNTNVTVWAEQNKFYKEIGPELVIKHSDGAVQMDASLQAQMSHSAGGQILKELMIADPGAAKAYYPQDSVFSPPKDAEADIPVQFTSNQGWDTP